MEFREMSEMQARFDAEHRSRFPWDAPVTPENIEVLEHLLVCVMGELGEFANVVKKIRRGDSRLEDALPALAEELGDTFIYLLKLGNQTGIDLEQTFLARIAFNRDRFRKYLK